MITKYVKPRDAAAILGVHVRTLAKWEDQGKIKAIKTPSGQRRYDVESYTGNFVEPIRITVIYARVSSRGQSEDLTRQIESLRELYPKAEIVGEIGGGLNFKRQKLLTLLERVMSGDVERIIVAHKDSVGEFGYDWLNWFCQKFECAGINQTNLSPETEMDYDDAILHCFSSRLYGLRKYKIQIQKDKDISKPGVEEGLE